LKQAGSEKLYITIAWLRQFSQLSILHNWQQLAHSSTDQVDNQGNNRPTEANWNACELDPERQIIFFDRGETNIQLRQTWQLPAADQ
jgi:hypothetical protein